MKSVLITGCSAGGIGAALADAFLARRWHVFATARTPSKISPSLFNSTHATVLQLDVTDQASIAAAVENVHTRTGRLDVLVNNGGTGIILPALDTSIEDGKRLFDVNFWGPLALIQAFAPLLIASGGCIVNNTSVSGNLPSAFQSMYGSSKAALLNGSESWRIELAPLGIRTLTLLTSAVKTRFFDNLTQHTLPSNSYYTGVKDFIYAMGDGRMQANGISAVSYAETVVRAVEQGKSGRLYVGASASMIRFAGLFPYWVLDSLMERMWPVASKMKSTPSK